MILKIYRKKISLHNHKICHARWLCSLIYNVIKCPFYHYYVGKFTVINYKHTHVNMCTHIDERNSKINRLSKNIFHKHQKIECGKTRQMFSRARNPSLFCNRFSPLYSFLYPYLHRTEFSVKVMCCCCCCLSIINTKWIVIKRKADPENLYTQCELVQSEGEL